jgi:hypothetical protein
LLAARPPAARPPAGNPSPDAFHFKNPIKPTLARHAVAAAVLHKHPPIIRVGADLIHFVYGSRWHLANGVCPSQKCSFLPGQVKDLLEHNRSDGMSVVEQIELQAKLLNYFLGSNKSNINHSRSGCNKT